MNVNIKDDASFLVDLNAIIDILNNKKISGVITKSESYILNDLVELKQIALGERQLQMPQKKYISFQRSLDEMPSIGNTEIGELIYKLIYYFAYKLNIK
jgi:hypothetical protein